MPTPTWKKCHIWKHLQRLSQPPLSGDELPKRADRKKAASGTHAAIRRAFIDNSATPVSFWVRMKCGCIDAKKIFVAAGHV
jgi:hypothetical protein